MSSTKEGGEVEALRGAMTALDLEGLDPREKYSAVVQRRFQRSLRELDERESQSHPFLKCRSCFLVKRDHCMCEELFALAGRVREVQAYPEVKFIIFMNDREYFRSSNTGKLVNHLIPGSEILIHGIPGSLERLQALLSQDLEDYSETVVLYPSQDSKSVHEYFSDLLKDKYSKLFRTDLGGLSRPAEFYKRLKLKVILIDGTWSQAKSINKSLPGEIPRIVISSKLISDFGPLRKQNKAGNISTVEAASLLIRDIAYVLSSDTIGCQDQVLANSVIRLRQQSDLLEESLRMLIKQVIAQCKREYLREILEHRNEKRFSSKKRESV